MSYGRWDRDRFERAGGGRDVYEQERFDERDYYGRGREEVDVEDGYRRTYAPARERSRSRGPVRESERIFFEDRYTSGAPVPYRPRREDVRYYDDRETVVERSGDMVPYRRREDDREIDIKFRESSRPFNRPQFVRRQSSLDTHDRRPLPRYGDRVREEIVVPAPPRRHTPSRYEVDYEDIRIAEPEYYGNEDYHPYREREKEIYRRRYPPPPPPAGEEIVYERQEEVVTAPEYPKKGKTRMPRRLVNIEAISKLGYEYTEEENTIVILKALGKENIDEVIRISREYNTTQILPPPIESAVPPQDEEIIERKTKIIKENPSLARSRSSSSPSSRSTSPTVISAKTRKSHKSHKSRRSSHYSSHRSRSTHRRHRSLSSSAPSRDLVIREPRSRYHYRDDPHSTALIIPNRERSRSRYRIEDEIRALEIEKKELELERSRHGHDYLLEKEYKDGSVEIKKDQKGKMSLIVNH